MTLEQIDRLRELLDKATPGPWAAVAAGQADDLNEVVAKNGYKSIADAEGPDAALIAESRNALPDMLAAIEAERTARLAAEAERDAYRAVLEGAEFREIDNIGKHSITHCRVLGQAVKLLTINSAATKDAEIARLQSMMSERSQMMASYNRMMQESGAREEAWKAEVARLREALAWYADPERYRQHPHGIAFDRRDIGYVARAALEDTP